MRVFVIAGEASGDMLGAAMMAGLKQLVPGVEFRGVGGAGMAAQGLESLFAMDELSLMGIVEILPKYFHLKRRIRQVAEAALAWQADVVVTIDSPDFCLRVARLIKAASDVKVVHYVAPSVWAWRPGRAAKMAPMVDHVLTLLPFEPPYMEAAGMGATFVGHPVVAQKQATAGEAAAFRARHGLDDAQMLLVLPGSRRGEIARLGPVFGEVLERLTRARAGGLRAVVAVAPGLEAEVRQAVQGWPGKTVLIKPQDAAGKRAAFVAADAALASSGTVALELAAAGTPMVVAYDMNWLSRSIITRLLRVKSVNLVNLVAESDVVPEFIGKNCRAALIAPALAGLLAAPDGQNSSQGSDQGEAMRLTLKRLGAGGEAPGMRAARAVLKLCAGPG